MIALRFFANIDEDEESVVTWAGAAMWELLITPCKKSFEGIKSVELQAAVAGEIDARSH
jgi:hypothetical protein